MPQKKQKKLERCPECGCAIKAANLDKHILRVHEIESQGHGGGGAIRPPSKAEERKKMELERKKMKMNIVFSVILISLVVIVLYFAFFSGDETDNPYTTFEEAVTDPDSGDVIIPIATITTDAKFYSYDFNGLKINYFVLKSSDGVIRAAFDACDQCFRDKKGYRQEGDEMVCNNCDMRFPSVKINVEEGGCNPAPLSRKIEGSDLVIKASDIKAGAWYFE